MIKQTYNDIVTPELLKGAIENNEYHGFREDYHVLHCLLRIHKPKSVFEIGCNCGLGTKIIKNAVMEAEVYSLDLPYELAHISLQSPVSEGKGDRVGHLCNLPFTLIREDSMKYDYSKTPCEAFYIDGEHTEKNVTHELAQVLKQNPKIVVLHDTDMPEVMQGILNSITDKYELYRVEDTRISYLLRK